MTEHEERMKALNDEIAVLMNERAVKDVSTSDVPAPVPATVVVSQPDLS